MERRSIRRNRPLLGRRDFSLCLLWLHPPKKIEIATPLMYGYPTQMFADMMKMSLPLIAEFDYFVVPLNANEPYLRFVLGFLIVAVFGCMTLLLSQMREVAHASATPIPSTPVKAAKVQAEHSPLVVKRLDFAPSFSPVICLWGDRVHYKDESLHAVAVITQKGVFQVAYTMGGKKDTMKKHFDCIADWEATLPDTGNFTISNDKWCYTDHTMQYNKGVLRAWSPTMLDVEILEILSSRIVSKDYINKLFVGTNPSAVNYALSSLQRRGLIWATRDQSTILYTLKQ
jgi:hypothetical protein